MPRKPNTNGDHYYDAFPARLRDLIKNRGITQDELRKVLGVKSRQSVTGYIDGSTKPTGEKIAALSEFFNVSSDFLLGLSDVPTNDKDLQAVCDYTGLNEDFIAFVADTVGTGYVTSAPEDSVCIISHERRQYLLNRVLTPAGMLKIITMLDAYKVIFDIADSKLDSDSNQLAMGNNPGPFLESEKWNDKIRFERFNFSENILSMLDEAVKYKEYREKYEEFRKRYYDAFSVKGSNDDKE